MAARLVSAYTQPALQGDAGALVSTEVGVVRFRTVPAERFCNSFAGLAADALRSSGCVSAFLECSKSGLVVLLAVKLRGFAVRFGRCAVKLCSFDLMCLGHEPISS
jgi:hypothetical protein